VESVELLTTKTLEEGDGSSKWKVSWNITLNPDQHNSVGTLESEIFDGVIVATGIFNVPSIPLDIPGLETFPGKQLQS